MIDELACKQADGNRTQMFIKLIKREYENAKTIREARNPKNISKL